MSEKEVFIKNKLKLLLVENNIKSVDFAKILGVHALTMSQYCTNKASIPIPKLEFIANYFNISDLNKLIYIEKKNKRVK